MSTLWMVAGIVGGAAFFGCFAMMMMNDGTEDM